MLDVIQLPQHPHNWLHVIPSLVIYPCQREQSRVLSSRQNHNKNHLALSPFFPPGYQHRLFPSHIDSGSTGGSRLIKTIRMNFYYRDCLAGSIPDGVIAIFHWHNTSGRTMAQRLTQPITEMNTRNISGGDKGDRCVGLTILPPSYADCIEIWGPQPPGTFRACPGL